MRVLTAGHKYEMDSFEGGEPQLLQFIEKTRSVDESCAQLFTINDGTTNEEVLSVLINRMSFLQEMCPCDENIAAIGHLAAALEVLNSRTADREKREVEGTHAE